jgi:hypothetical protein
MCEADEGSHGIRSTVDNFDLTTRAGEEVGEVIFDTGKDMCGKVLEREGEYWCRSGVGSGTISAW